MSDYFVVNKNAYPLSRVSAWTRASTGLLGIQAHPIPAGILGQSTGLVGHEVHRIGCQRGPDNRNAIPLDWQISPERAVVHARIMFGPGTLIDGCFYCCKEMHEF